MWQTEPSLPLVGRRTSGGMDPEQPGVATTAAIRSDAVNRPIRLGIAEEHRDVTVVLESRSKGRSRLGHH